MFQLKNIRYKSILSLDDLQIEAHRVTSIVGQSGAGKSTFLKLLNRMIDPDQGEIRLDGLSLSEIDPIKLRRKVVMLGQEPVIFDRDLRENMNIGRRFSEKESLPDEKLQRLLQIVHLHKNLNDDPLQFSGGEKQRVAIGRILAMEADVYLLDEPTSALDEETELDVLRSFVHEIREQNKTVVMVTHSAEAAKEVSDHMITLPKIGEAK